MRSITTPKRKEQRISQPQPDSGKVTWQYVEDSLPAHPRKQVLFVFIQEAVPGARMPVVGFGYYRDGVWQDCNLHPEFAPAFRAPHLTTYYEIRTHVVLWMYVPELPDLGLGDWLGQLHESLKIPPPSFEEYVLHGLKAEGAGAMSQQERDNYVLVGGTYYFVNWRELERRLYPAPRPLLDAFGVPIVTDQSLPENEVHFRQNGRTVAKIINIGFDD